MSFDRWVPTWPRTWPYTIFKRHHTELNDLYWSHAIAANHSREITKNEKSEARIDSLLKAPPVESRRFAYSIKEWSNHYKDYENWTRLNALIAITGYVETYLHGVITLALTSDPGALLKSPRVVDGISLIKRGALPDVSAHVAGITKGTWPDRIERYRTLFSKVPAVLEANTDELDAMRKMRNGVGHAFGRVTDQYKDPLTYAPAASQRLSEIRLKKWLGIAEDSVNSVEEHLRSQHIGAIEALLRYHSWDRIYQKGHVPEERAFQGLFPNTQGNPPKPTYFRKLIAHYHAA